MDEDRILNAMKKVKMDEHRRLNAKKVESK